MTVYLYAPNSAPTCFSKFGPNPNPARKVRPDLHQCCVSDDIIAYNCFAQEHR